MTAVSRIYLALQSALDGIFQLLGHWFDANRDDFRQMAVSTSVPQPETREIFEDERLHIIKPSLRRKLRWEVLHKGNRTTVTMKDESFLDYVEAGAQFAKGDTLFVSLNRAKAGQATPNVRQ